MAEKTEKPSQKGRPQDTDNEMLIRILGQDIKGSRTLGAGLTHIKGVSWSVSNALCHSLKLDRTKRIGSLSKEDIKVIETGLRSLPVPVFLKNRPNDRESGKAGHLFGVELDMRKEFDIKRMKQIKSYKGVRHTFKLPVRGQRTRSHFRKSGMVMGVKKPKSGKKS